MNLKCFITLAFISIFFICQNNQKAEQFDSPYEDLLVFPEANQASGESEEPKMTFQSTEYDFGSALAKDKIEHTFYFENTGKKDLIIVDTESSCGCTVPHYSKDPIQAGEQGEIKIVFDTDGKSGDQEKKVTIFTNTNPNKHYLIIKGHVIPNE